MNAIMANKINEHHKKCGSKEYYQMRIHMKDEVKVVYICKECKGYINPPEEINNGSRVSPRICEKIYPNYRK